MPPTNVEEKVCYRIARLFPRQVERVAVTGSQMAFQLRHLVVPRRRAAHDLPSQRGNPRIVLLRKLQVALPLSLRKADGESRLFIGPQLLGSRSLGVGVDPVLQLAGRMGLGPQPVSGVPEEPVDPKHEHRPRGDKDGIDRQGLQKESLLGDPLRGESSIDGIGILGLAQGERPSAGMAPGLPVVMVERHTAPGEALRGLPARKADPNAHDHLGIELDLRDLAEPHLFREARQGLRRKDSTAGRLSREPGHR